MKSKGTRRQRADIHCATDIGNQAICCTEDVRPVPLAPRTVFTGFLKIGQIKQLCPQCIECVNVLDRKPVVLAS